MTLRKGARDNIPPFARSLADHSVRGHFRGHRLDSPPTNYDRLNVHAPIV
jgi:hypothetical protein